MKKVLKILGIVLALIVLMILGAGIAVQSPSVQTKVMDRVLYKFRNSIDGDLKVGSVAMSPFNAVVLNDIVIIDRYPYSDHDGTGLPRIDTLASINHISVTLSPFSIFGNSGLHFHRVRAHGMKLYLTVEPSYSGIRETTTNLSRIFGLNPENKKGITGDVADIARISVEDFRFRLINYPGRLRMLSKGKETPPDAVDFNDLDLAISLKAHGFRLHDHCFSFSADELLATDKSGCTFFAEGYMKFGATETKMTGLHLVDDLSDVRVPQLRFSYRDLEALKDILSEVRIQAKIAPSVLDFQTLAWFVPELKGNTFRPRLTAEVDGYINDLKIEKLSFLDEGSGVSLTSSLSVTGLPDAYGMYTNVRIPDLSFTTEGLGKLIKEWAPNEDIDLSSFAPGEGIHFKGSASGPVNRLHFNGKLFSERLGSVDADADIRNAVDPERPILLNGKVSTENLYLGKILGVDEVGRLTLEADLGCSLDGDNVTADIRSLSISRLGLLGYDYTGIRALGSYSNSAFDGRLVCNDPNLNFMFEGLFNLSSTTSNAAYQFYANLGYADLNALHLDRRGKSRVSLKADANFMSVEGKDILGDILVSDVILENSAGRYNIGDISITSHANDDINRFRFQSSFADGTYISPKPVSSFLSDLLRLTVYRELPSLLEVPAGKWDPTRYDLNFKIHDLRDVLAFVAPGAYIAENTNMKLKITENGRLDGRIASQRLAFHDKYLKDIDISITNEGTALEGAFTCSEISIGDIRVKNGKGSIFADDDNIEAGVSYGNSPDQMGDIRLSGGIARDRNKDLILTAQALPSVIRFQKELWTFQSDECSIRGGDVHVNNFHASNNGQLLTLDGGISPSRTDTLTLGVQKFDISVLNSLLGKDLDLRGLASGSALLTSPTKPNIGLLASLSADESALGGIPLGTLHLESAWNEAAERFDLIVGNEFSDTTNIRVDGFLKPSTREISADASLNAFRLGYAAPMLKDVFSEFDGKLSGRVHAGGTLDSLKLGSESLEIRDGRIGIDYTGVTYLVNGPVSLDRSGLRFLDDAVSDGIDGRGVLGGGISFAGVPALDIDITGIHNLLAIDLGSVAENRPFFGKLYADGAVSIKGPFDDILLSINARTVKDGNIHIPLSGTKSSGASDILTFWQPTEEEIEDPYEAMVAKITSVGQKVGHFTVRVGIEATPDATVYLDLGAGTGNTISAQGNGDIVLESRTPEGLFTINGDYGITSGDLNVSAMGLVSRNMTIQNGSSLRFNGGLMDTELDIDALYTLKASLANLISDENAATTRRTVECGVNITDKLSNPQISFSIDIPDLDPSTQSIVRTALNTEDKIQKQFIYLLIAGNFLPDEESGIINTSSDMLYSNVSNIMAGQLNNIMDMLEIPLDLGLNYSATESGSSLFDVALSTQLFNNRIVVNGNIGNRTTAAGTATEDVVGDIDVEYKIDKGGTFRLKAFSHSADQYTSYLDNSQRNGVGFSIQREFNTFKEFFRNLFRSRRNRDQETPEGKITIQVDSTGTVKNVISQ